MKRILLAFSLAALSTLSHAVTETGTVDYLTAISSNETVTFNLVMTNKPARSCGSDSRWSIKMDGSEISKMQYAMVLAALNSGKDITVSEHGVCEVAPYGRFADSIKARS